MHDAVAEFDTAKTTGKLWWAFEASLSFATADPGDASPLVAEVQAAEKETSEQSLSVVLSRHPTTDLWAARRDAG
jgi:hypothetical protein